MAEHFSDSQKTINPEIEGGQKIPSPETMNKTTPKHINQIVQKQVMKRKSLK